MHAPASNPHATPDSRVLLRDIFAYRELNNARSVFELAITAVPFVLIWVVMWTALDAGYWICMVLAVAAAGFLVRLFMIQHDCGHSTDLRQHVVPVCEIPQVIVMADQRSDIKSSRTTS